MLNVIKIQHSTLAVTNVIIRKQCKYKGKIYSIKQVNMIFLRDRVEIQDPFISIKKTSTRLSNSCTVIKPFFVYDYTLNRRKVNRKIDICSSNFRKEYTFSFGYVTIMEKD